jgi:Aspartyl protease
MVVMRMRGEALGLRHVILVCAFAAACVGVAAAQETPAAIFMGDDHSRATIPIEINGIRTQCILDTGASTILVSRSLAYAAGLAPGAGATEIAPNGTTYDDSATSIAHFAVANRVVADLPALISSKLDEAPALCGYDFFARFPTLIDRDRSIATLFPSPNDLAQLRCTPVDLSSRLPIAGVLLNGTALSNVVLDSGLSGGGIFWNGALSRLPEPIVPQTGAAANEQNDMSCGRTALAAFFFDAPASPIQVCSSATRPGGHDGMLQTNLAAVREVAIDYPNGRMCFRFAER